MVSWYETILTTPHFGGLSPLMCVAKKSKLKSPQIYIFFISFQDVPSNSTGFEEKDGNLTEIEVDEVLGFVSNV